MRVHTDELKTAKSNKLETGKWIINQLKKHSLRPYNVRELMMFPRQRNFVTPCDTHVDSSKPKLALAPTQLPYILVRRFQMSRNEADDLVADTVEQYPWLLWDLPLAYRQLAIQETSAVNKLLQQTLQLNT